MPRPGPGPGRWHRFLEGMRRRRHARRRSFRFQERLLRQPAPGRTQARGTQARILERR